MFSIEIMFHVLLIAVGKLKNRNFKEICEEYIQRIATFAKIEIIEVDSEPSFSSSDIRKVQKKEEERIEKILRKKRGVVFLLSEDGRQYTSPEFSRLITSTHESYIFVVGGSFGFSEDFKKTYHTCSLSPLTFPHELARVLLIEQLYRAISLNQNTQKYHK